MRLSDYRELGKKGAYPDWVRELNNQHGVYVIRCKRTKNTLYVGFSSSKRLYGTLTRHFQSVGEWYNVGGQEKPTYHRQNVEVAVIKTKDPQQASELEQHYICELHPKDNRYSLADCEVPF